MGTCIRLLSVVGLLLGLSCERSGDRLMIPSGLGRGQSDTDSLRALFAWLSDRHGYEADTLRLQVLYELTRRLRSNAPDTAMQVAQVLDEAAKRSSYPPGRGLSHLAYGEAWLGKARYDSALSHGQTALIFFTKEAPHYLANAHLLIGEILGRLGKYDSLRAHAQQAIALAQTTGNKAWIAAGYDALGVSYHQQGEYEEALEYYQKALAIQEELSDKRGLMASYNKIGLIHYTRGQYPEALASYQKSLQIAQQIGDKTSMAMNLNYTGTIYYAHGQYAEALSAHQAALKIWEEIGNKTGLAVSYINIGNIYSDQKRYAEALTAYEKSMAIFKQIGDKRGMATGYNNIGNVYLNQSKYAEALAAHQEALALRQQIGSKEGMAKSYHNIGNVLMAQGRYAEALMAHRKAARIGEEIGDTYNLTFYYTGIGDVLDRQRQPHLGRPYLLKALQIAQQLRANERLSEIYHKLAENDSLLALSNPHYWREAYAHLHLHQLYRDSVWNEETVRRIERLQAQYEYEKREAELKSRQERERARAAAEVRRREVERNYALALVALLIASTGTLAYFLSVIRRQKRQLESTNHQLKQLNADLEVANAELRTINHALEEANKLIKQQNSELEEKNQDIMDSIRYAERIQRALLPSEARWRSLLPESFVLYKPRDMVAGDFYWLGETEQHIYLGVADATGHGVPGAFVSLVCIQALNKAIREEGLKRPGEILGRVQQLVVGQLTLEGERVRDGMDIALIQFDKSDPRHLRFSGANRPLWLIRKNGEVVEAKGTRQPVGYVEELKVYEEIELDIEDGGMVYAFTDGVVDQLGGDRGRKLMTKGLREALLKIYREPVEVQRKWLETFLTEWQGGYRQVDDITLVGVRVEGISKHNSAFVS